MLNLELLCNTIFTLKNKLPNKRRALIFLRNHCKNALFRKSKLRLGRLAYDYKEIKFLGISLGDGFVIRHIGRSHTDDDDAELEAVIERHK
jgi:hypothetical protein